MNKPHPTVTLAVQFVPETDDPRHVEAMQQAAARFAAHLQGQLTYLTVSAISAAFQEAGITPAGGPEIELTVQAGAHTLHQSKPGAAPLH
jgi:hypothetical protein